MAVSRVIGKQVGGSFPGTPSRSGDQLIQVKLASGEIEFGTPVSQTENEYEPFDGDETTLAGIAVRKVGQPNVYVGQADYNKYLDGEDCDALTRGFITVKIADKTSLVIGLPVSIVTVAGDSGFEVNDFVTSSTPMGTGSSVEITGWVYSTPAGDDDIVEVHILTSAI